MVVPPSDRETDLSSDVSSTGSSLRQEQHASHSASKDDTSSLRSVLGAGTSRFSDFINDNIIAARYGAIASIAVLSAYAISQTPLFFRYRTVAEIPSHLFKRRKYITGRLMVCNSKNNNNANTSAAISGACQPITCYLRHLSPIERLLSKSWLDRLLKLYPAATYSNGRPEESPHELIEIQIAGIQYPAAPKNNSSAGSMLNQISLGNESDQELSVGKEWLRKLADQRSLVKCQLLGRRLTAGAGASNPMIANRSKRPIPGLSANSAFEMAASTKERGRQLAVAKLFYRPKLMDLVRTDVGEAMILKGYAVVSDDGLYPHTAAECVTDTTDEAKILQRDAAYMDKLGRAEFQAARGSYGVWSDPVYRASRADVVDEVEFQENASIVRKAWRWWRG
jgi:endonuclease YncB( thermonuclease family)